jgi:hypothetical protein
MSDESLNLISDGTIIQENGKIYLFKDDRRVLSVGQIISSPAAMLWLKDKLGRKLTQFELLLLISELRGGTTKITIIGVITFDNSQHNALLAASYKPIGYSIRRRASSSSVNYGDVIQTEGFYDKNGKLYGELRQSRKQEPPLEKPLLDPIDFVAGPLANIIRGAAKKLIGSVVAGIEERLLARGASSELAKLAAMTDEELSLIRGGAASSRPPRMSADALNKPVPQIKDGMGAKLMLSKAERDGAQQIARILERVRNGDSWAWAELIPGRRIQQLKFGKLAQQGWTEIDLLVGNPGAYNRMRMLVRVSNGDIDYKLMQVH